MIIGSCTGEQSHSGDDPSLEDITFEELVDRIQNGRGGRGLFVGVITSYSIHYTKLYDSLLTPSSIRAPQGERITTGVHGRQR